MTQGHFLSGVWQVWIQSFPSPRLVALPRLKNLVCPTILPIAGARIIGFIPFPRVLVLCEMQSVSSRIWTRVAVSISYDDNHYTTVSGFPFVWLPYIERRLPYYLSIAGCESKRGGFMPSPRAWGRSEKHRPRPESEIGWAITFPTLITVWSLAPLIYSTVCKSVNN